MTLSLPVVVPAVSKNPRIGLMMSIGIGVRGDQRDRFAARMPPPTPWEQVRKLLSRVFPLDAFGELGQNVGGACERSLHPGGGGFICCFPVIQSLFAQFRRSRDEFRISC